MDYLHSAIQNLTSKELALLKKKIKDQRIKSQLLTLMQKHPDIDNKELSTQLNYNDNLTNLYTLKNRLLDDIVNIKIELSKNEVTLIKEKIQNLRQLVYSKDRYSLIRELKKLEKTCNHLELFDELREVYFCFFLTFRHDHKKSAKYLKSIAIAEQKQLLTSKMEEIFYSAILDCQDLFYLPNRYAYDKIMEQLQKIKEIHDKLNNRTSSFFYLSGELTLKLGCFFNPMYKEDIHKQLNQLFKTYNYSFLVYKYPHCDVAIQCLYSRYYYLTKSDVQFKTLHKDVLDKIFKVKGYQMFDCSYYYFTYITVLHYIEKKEFDRVVDFIEEMINVDYVGLVSARLRNHFLYLLAVKEYYQGNFSKSSSLLLKSRTYFNYLDILSSWVAIENILLNILNATYMMEFKTIESDIYLIRRMIKKFHLEKEYNHALSNLFRTVKQVESGSRNVNDIANAILLLKKYSSAPRLIVPTTVVEESQQA